MVNLLGGYRYKTVKAAVGDFTGVQKVLPSKSLQSRPAVSHPCATGTLQGF